jgi:hypothetical protein
VWNFKKKEKCPEQAAILGWAWAAALAMGRQSF